MRYLKSFKVLALWLQTDMDSARAFWKYSLNISSTENIRYGPTVEQLLC